MESDITVVHAREEPRRAAAGAGRGGRVRTALAEVAGKTGLALEAGRLREHGARQVDAAGRTWG